MALIDRGDVVGDLRHQRGGIGQAACDSTRQAYCPPLSGCVDQRLAGRPWRHRRCRAAALVEHAVFAGLEVDGLLDASRRRRAAGGRSRPCPCGRCSPRRSSCRQSGQVAAHLRDRRSSWRQRLAPCDLSTCGCRSRPTRSSRPKMPVLGMPIGRPMTASASSTVRPSSTRRVRPRPASRRRRCGWR